MTPKGSSAEEAPGESAGHRYIEIRTPASAGALPFLVYLLFISYIYNIGTLRLQESATEEGQVGVGPQPAVA